MKKLVINKCYGGFGLSIKAIRLYHQLAGNNIYIYKLVGEKLVETVPEKTPHSIFYVFTKEQNGKFPQNSKEAGYWYDADLDRDDPILVKVVEQLGDEASGECAQLKIVEIPDSVDWLIDDYDGMERVEEKHQSWG